MLIADFQSWLDDHSRATLAGDFDTVRRQCHLPLVVMGCDRLSVISTATDLRNIFGNQQSMLKINKVTDIVASAQDLTCVAAGKMAGEVRIEFISNGIRVMEPYVSRLTLRKLPDGWKMSKLVSGLLPRYRYLVHADTRPVPRLFQGSSHDAARQQSLPRSA